MKTKRLFLPIRLGLRFLSTGYKNAELNSDIKDPSGFLADSKKLFRYIYSV